MPKAKLSYGILEWRNILEMENSVELEKIMFSFCMTKFLLCKFMIFQSYYAKLICLKKNVNNEVFLDVAVGLLLR